MITVVLSCAQLTEATSHDRRLANALSYMVYGTTLIRPLHDLDLTMHFPTIDASSQQRVR